MGRIKSTMIKRASKQLMEGEDRFTEKFEENKRILGNNMPSKSLRNKIAGYISRLKKMKRIEKERLALPKKVNEETMDALVAKGSPEYE